MSLSRTRRSVIAMLAALALVATACGGGSDTAVATADDSAVAASSSEAAPAEADAEPEAEAAPAISLVADTISGGQIDFASLAGQDVVLWFWAPW